ncbi:disintegrin and metalloproteinase domain-containing protein 2-like [Buteo buteo]|uniref:disintegrin and metalloproteinase domain-containing protein 2-like n=1 Tax=Buteo buteo TaxID=30397 RepID=UPI003EB9D6CC
MRAALGLLLGLLAALGPRRAGAGAAPQVGAEPGTPPPHPYPSPCPPGPRRPLTLLSPRAARPDLHHPHRGDPPHRAPAAAVSGGQRVFLPEDFRIYTDGRGGLAKSELAHIERDCFYEGYVEGFPVSLVALSTCSGLSGILQLMNASYGIKPLEAAAGYQHLVYPMWNENIKTRLFIENSSLAWTVEVSLEPEDAIASKQAVHRSSWYLEMHAVLDKSLYDYMGADKDAVTAKIVQLFSYVNSMFARLNLTIVLSSLELWTEKNKIPTTGGVEELLQRFLQWKNVHRVLRLQDITFLFVYREQSHYVGASSAKKLCLKNNAGGVALYQRAMTLEAFAVVVAQLLGLSLGMAYDDPGSCHCAGAACIMQASLVHLAGVKAFSSCSIRDFQHFLATGGGQCLLNRPAMDTAYKAPVCGNKVVEPGEACDCGTTEICKQSLSLQVLPAPAMAPPRPQPRMVLRAENMVLLWEHGWLAAASVAEGSAWGPWVPPSTGEPGDGCLG